MSLHTKYLETSRRSKANWAAMNRDRINARRRERRLEKRVERLGDKHCLNCEVLLKERLNWSPGRSYEYCRKCLDERPDEVRRHRWRRYYYRMNNKIPKRATKRVIDRVKDTPSYHAIEVIDEPTRIDPFKGFTINATVSKKTRTPILICPCSNRYLKTRRGQTCCLRCIAYGVDKSGAQTAVMLQ